jgi:hypothetical protein
MNHKKYTNELLIKAVTESKSFAEVLRKLELKQAGGTQYHIKKQVEQLGLDTSHFTGALWNKGRSLKPLNEQKTKAGRRRFLILERGQKCEHCGLDSWCNKPITLEVHHIDGNRHNNITDNLLLLCPNCHSYTNYWRGKK